LEFTVFALGLAIYVVLQFTVFALGLAIHVVLQFTVFALCLAIHVVLQFTVFALCLTIHVVLQFTVFALGLAIHVVLLPLHSIKVACCCNIKSSIFYVSVLSISIFFYTWPKKRIKDKSAPKTFHFPTG
jgi:hypothetical protein